MIDAYSKHPEEPISGIRFRRARRIRDACIGLLVACTLTLSAAAAPAQTDVRDLRSPARVRLISQEQYFNTIAYVFGPDITVAAHFAPFIRTDGLLANGAAGAGLTLSQIQEFQRTANGLAARVTAPGAREFLLPCKPRRSDRADAACARRFLAGTGRLLHRGALSQESLDALVTEAGEAAARLGDFHTGLAVALEGLLMAPGMLFIVDRTEADPRHPDRQRLDGYSLASRLSLFLWNAGPDEELLQAAENGSLQTPAGRDRQITRMLASPRLETGVRAFFDDMLRFDDLAVLSKDPTIYPAFGGETLADAREQTLRTIVDHLVSRGGDYRDLFTTRHTYLSPALAVIYGVTTPPGWNPYESPADDPRAGLLTQVSFLAGHAHPGRSSPTLRGKALRELLLCQRVPRPPPNVDFSLLEDANSRLPTQRERLALHRTNPVCAGCHKITDPIGLALENFDGAGQFRATEGGAPIDASGVLDGKPFEDSLGLTTVLRDHPALSACLVRRVYSWGTGGAAREEDKPMLEWLGRDFASNGYRLPDLMRSIATSAAFANVDLATSEVAANSTSGSVAGGR